MEWDNGRESKKGEVKMDNESESSKRGWGEGQKGEVEKGK